MHGTLVNVTPALETSKNQYRQSMEEQVAHFADALRSGKKPMGSGDEILTVMELMDAVYKSAEIGREVKVG
jgi:predicted dehydrogenase